MSNETKFGETSTGKIRTVRVVLLNTPKTPKINLDSHLFEPYFHIQFVDPFHFANSISIWCSFPSHPHPTLARKCNVVGKLLLEDLEKCCQGVIVGDMSGDLSILLKC